ncbi:MAG: hypothetical protein WBN39_05915 [Flavobacteriaceae bacterium]
MVKALLPLVNWGNGIIMIGVFAVVVIVLVVTLINLMNSGKEKSGKEN